jgi:hypothetical protein
MDILSVAGRFGLMSAETRFLTNANGAKVAVVIPIEQDEELMEDLADLAVVVERRDEPRASLEDVKRRLKDDGLLRSTVRPDSLGPARWL